MLKIYLGEMEGAVYHPPTYFDNQYNDEWITDPLTIEMIKDVDKSDVVGPHLIESPVLGPIPVKSISGGVKTLILLAFDESGKVFNASACGDNCAKFILKLAKERDVTINLRHLMEFGKSKFEAIVLNDGKKVCGMDELFTEAYKYV